ncbi:Carboxypeptidase regulatory-like domain-containing protein [Stigmatella aurantiaca]|uniref:Carboxypeptidase regulatory-like domain-containing protein n=1 Tax=Stigmatella aurantiaca TaxID=41 RepID=A0A1H8A5G8_STIAU|nr:carboxypeptidase-like regulatory domain-containing protein [Stigmatella aurantiaca]SEM65995.1 Carboxypeptidase regulatory-like domain-containing protein [Stigmatella aurantiaca]
MRSRLQGGLVMGVMAAAVGLALYGQAEERKALREDSASSSEAAKAAGVAWEAASWDELPVTVPRTLPMAESASEADGLLDLRVTEAGRPVSRAQVRLYQRGGRLPETGQVDWRLAGAGATGDDGRLLMPARAGAYLVAAHALGAAPAWRELIHPLSGNRTPVHLSLVTGGSLAGRTVEQGSGQPLGGAELVLTPHVSVWEPDARADVPPEERVMGQSDASGRFFFDGLAPGVYTVAARAPGTSRVTEWSVRIPTDEARLLALPDPDDRVGRRRPRKAPSQELRCGI